MGPMGLFSESKLRHVQRIYGVGLVCLTASGEPATNILLMLCFAIACAIILFSSQCIRRIQNRCRCKLHREPFRLPYSKFQQEIYAQRAQTSADPEDPDVGLWTPGSEAWSGSPPKIVSLGPWAMPYPSKKIRQNPFTNLRVIRRTDRQTDRQTNRQIDRTKNITSFFGGGNKLTAT